MVHKEIYIELQDTQWQFDYIDHDRNIARAIVYDENGIFYFVRAERDDDFGKATLIETAGGGVEVGEELQTAIQRELKEELGVSVEIVFKIGVVSDYYNLIHRHNINNYFLCKVKSFGEKNLTQDEIDSFHLSTLQLSYEEAVREYENRKNTRLGTLVANRELPILYRAKEIIDSMDQHMEKYPDEIEVGLAFSDLKYDYAVKKMDQDAILDTGNSFKGMVHPDDLKIVESDISSQIKQEKDIDQVQYRIKCKDGTIKTVLDYGRFVHTEMYGNVYYVFMNDISKNDE